MEEKRSIRAFLSAALVSALLSTMVSACSSDADAPDVIPPSTPAVADWVREARIAGVDIDPTMDDASVDAILLERKTQNVSVLEVDSGLSENLSDDEFKAQVTFLDGVAKRAHNLGMHAVIYYPSLEVLTQNAETMAHSMYKDHPDWIQMGIGGKPNVFYGGMEHWVDPGAESAWMSPNTGYKDYFLGRIRKLARTALDGVWADVPIYLETGASWAGAEPAAAKLFHQWTVDRGIGGAGGYEVPATADFKNAAFRAWVRFRHENLADFTEAIRIAAQSVKPDFLVAIETFPIDDMDMTTSGLDGTVRRSAHNFIRVWEVDSVSNTKGMQWSTTEDFDNKIAMFKWARTADHENPSWAFSYGNEPLDAALVMAAAVATGNAPFESKTPIMTVTAGSEFRTRWFKFIGEHLDALLKTPRTAQVGVWYSSPSRDYQDFTLGGSFGLYATIEPPKPDPDWWASDDADSALPKPMLGGWRGAAHALIELGVPFKPILDPSPAPGTLRDALAGLSLVWLPSVAALSDDAIMALSDFAKNGGVVLATGQVPAQMDEMGNARASNPLAELFGFSTDPATMKTGPHTRTVGAGLVLYRPDLVGGAVFGLVNDPDAAAQSVLQIEQLIRTHVLEDVSVEITSMTTAANAPGVFVEEARPTAELNYLYVVNYTGLKLPAVSNPVDIAIRYRAPVGYRVVKADSASPDDAGQKGTLVLVPEADGVMRITLHIDQFSLITLTLAAAPPPEKLVPYDGPSFATPERKEAAQSGLAFILNSMRDAKAPAPWSFGVYTNLKDRKVVDSVYVYGHDVTAEHMGLLLRASACMKDASSFQQAYRYVNELMISPTYHVVNWAMDTTLRRPYVQISDDGLRWEDADSPLDDFRVVHGLLLGPRQTGLPEAAMLARTILRGLYFTSVTDRAHRGQPSFPSYPGGVVGYSFDFSEVDDPKLKPPAVATGMGAIFIDTIPIDYQDLDTVEMAEQLDPRWRSVLSAGTDLVLASEIGAPDKPTGLFWNGLEGIKFVGDFENRDLPQGLYLKAIQELWTAIALARPVRDPAALDDTRRKSSLAAAQRSLAFFKAFYLTNHRIPEYLATDGTDAPDCGPMAPVTCLQRGTINLFDGEARIYALLARLSLLLGDPAFAAMVIDKGILTDRVAKAGDPRYGLIGVSTAETGDAEAWNVLESVLTLCIEAGGT